jgi:hypothetical protein
LGFYLGSKYDFKFNVSTKSEKSASGQVPSSANSQVTETTNNPSDKDENSSPGEVDSSKQNAPTDPTETKRLLVFELKKEQTKAASELYKSFNREVLYNLLQAALSGSSESQYLLGCFYESKCYIYSLIKENGEILLIDKPLADLSNFWLEKAAAKGNTLASLKIVLRNFAGLDARSYDPTRMLSHINSIKGKDLKDIPFADDYLSALSSILAGEVR